MTADVVPGVLGAACPRTRAARPDDAVAGVMPRYVASPASVAEASAVMRAAAAEGMAVVPRGTRARLDWGSPPARCDLVVDTGQMNQVLEHAAGDQVVRVQAGVRLDELAQVLAQAGQRLALDPPPAGSSGRRGGDAAADGGPAAGTVGGVLATGAAGPLRLRYGTGRDLLIGITVVRADGTVARSGGKVVKNVAGYDLGKLFAGSYGTLGLIAEATFRLHPAPGAASYITLHCTDAAAADAAIATAADSPLAPSAAEIDRQARGTPVRVGILLEGDPDGVAERSGRMAGLLSEATGAGGSDAASSGAGSISASPTPPPWWGRGAAAVPDGTVIRVAFWAGALTEVLAAVDAAAAAAGLDPAVSGSAAAGVLYAAVDEQAGPAAVAQFIAALRAAVTGGWAVPGSRAPGSVAQAGSPAAGPGTSSATGPPSPGSIVVLRAPPGVRAVADLWGPVPALGLMRAVKDQFDPEHRMAPGRFAGGI
jgi:glycolate oxidase FAD binding subunit